MNLDPNELQGFKRKLDKMFSEPVLSELEQEFAQLSDSDQNKCLDMLGAVCTYFSALESRLAGLAMALDRNETARCELADAMKAKHG